MPRLGVESIAAVQCGDQSQPLAAWHLTDILAVLEFINIVAHRTQALTFLAIKMEYVSASIQRSNFPTIHPL
ncbi:hypothetical protein QWZ16_20010 [Vibrio ostreicida]|uniref:Uncharacterized protein n=1 Tax=Vibrio ostreicida TaxID=526588 RepID=A0ABT8BXH5_9VIBR|nr:hypothetical protein [Vibrio ostreicida]MDN3611882.1 hypothetical protein [Vibrio ostreicida]